MKDKANLQQVILKINLDKIEVGRGTIVNKQEGLISYEKRETELSRATVGDESMISFAQSSKEPSKYEKAPGEEINYDTQRLLGDDSLTVDDMKINTLESEIGTLQAEIASIYKKRLESVDTKFKGKLYAWQI